MAKVKGMFRRGRIWWLRFSVNGVQYRESLETEFEELATTKAVQVIHQAPLVVAREWEAELDTYLAESVARGRLSRYFAPSRRYVLMAFARKYGISRLSDLSFSGVERWVADMRGEGGKPGTIESYVMHLRAFGTWLVKKNKIRENVAAKIDLGKVEIAVRKNFVAKETVAHLIKNARDDEMRFILYCGFHAGMRKLEVIEARPDWFRLGTGKRRGCISIEKTATFSPKDRDERTVPLTKDFEEFLKGYGLKKPFMLRPKKKQGKHKYRYDFDKAFENYMKKEGVTCTFHDTRRTFVSLKLIDDSSLIFKLAKWTGDDVKVLQDHYAHLLADDEDIEVGL